MSAPFEVLVGYTWRPSRTMLEHAVSGTLRAGCGVVIAMRGRHPKLGKTYTLCSEAAKALMGGRDVVFISSSSRQARKAFECTCEQLVDCPVALQSQTLSENTLPAACCYLVGTSTFWTYTARYAVTNSTRIVQEACSALVLIDDVMNIDAVNAVNEFAAAAASGQLALCAISQFSKADCARLMPGCHVVDWFSLCVTNC